jgi:hypothetical protein
MVVPLLLASLLAVTPAEPASPADPTVSFARSMEGRHARLLEGLELAATFKPSETPALRITDATRLGLMDAPLPLDTGGAQIQGETRQILGFLLGLIIGFGTGHLLVRDQGGFLLFLVVDVAIIVVSTVFRIAFGGWFWGLGGLGLLVSHVIQAVDVLGKAGGPRVVEETRRKAVLVSDVTGGRDAPPITTRAFAFSF